jgi:hypothetical protein
MRTSLNIVALIILYFSNTWADDIQLRNGQTLKNCLVVDTIGTRIIVNTSEGQKSIPLTSIEKIIKSELNSSQPTYILNADGSTKALTQASKTDESHIQITTKSDYFTERKYSYPKIFLLPISAITFGLAWDYFSQVGDIQDVIDYNNKSAELSKTQVDNSKLESQKSRKTVLGITFLVAGIVNAVFAFERVEVTSTSNSVGLSYKF